VAPLTTLRDDDRMTERGKAGVAAIALVALLGATLILMEVLDASWLGFPALALFFAALGARSVTINGLQVVAFATAAYIIVLVVALLINAL
jgi:hypothetical protein